MTPDIISKDATKRVELAQKQHMKKRSEVWLTSPVSAVPILNMTVEVVQEISREFSSGANQLADLSQALVMFINFYKEVEELSGTPIPKEGFKPALLRLRQDLAKSLQWHSLKKIKVDLPDLEIIQENHRALKTRADTLLSNLNKHIVILKETHVELSKSKYDQMNIEIKQKTE